MKILQQLLVKKKTVVNLMKSLDWRKIIEVILKKNLIGKSKSKSIDQIIRHNS